MSLCGRIKEDKGEEETSCCGLGLGCGVSIGIISAIEHGMAGSIAME